MAFDDEKSRSGKRLVQIVDVELDYCQLTYGIAPCAAVLGLTGQHKCHNTFVTCQDTDNYSPAAKTYRFVLPIEGLPRSVDAIPSLRRVTMSPPVIDPGRSLGKRASVTCEFQDHPHGDRNIDKYARERITGAAAADGSSYDPFEQGTFFGKLRARNPYFIGRLLHVYSGFLPWDHDLPPDQQPAWTEAEVFQHLEKRTYVQERWEGPDANGRFTIVAKDILKLADDDRAQAPLPSKGLLAADITDSATSATLKPTGIGDQEYPTSGYVKIGEEEIAFTRSGDTLTLTQRGAENTEAAAHDEDDTVQLVLVYDAQKPSAIVQDLLENYANIPAAYIPIADWTSEDDTYIGRLYSAHIVEPTPVNQLINELMQQAGFYIWWDEVAQQIPFRALRQPDVVTISLNDDNAFLHRTIHQREQPDKRRSQVWVYYGLIRPTEDIDKGKNYRAILVTPDVSAESSNEYGRPAIEKIYARWITRFNRPAAEDLANRVLQRYRDPPRRFEFTVPAVHSNVGVGTVFNATTRLIQDVFGAKSQRRMIALSKEDTGEGRYRIQAEEFLFHQEEDGGGVGGQVKRVVISTDTNNFNLRTEFFNIYGSLNEGDIVECEIEPGVIVGSTSTSIPAFDTDVWPEGNELRLINRGRIAGKGAGGGQGGNGNDGGDPASHNGRAGAAGGVALRVRAATKLNNTSGIIAGGGGGGGGGGGFTCIVQGTFFGRGGGGGGGGAGHTGGAGAPPGAPQNNFNELFGPNGKTGDDGTLTAGGAGGDGGQVNTAPPIFAGDGGDGGGPGQAGQSGQAASVPSEYQNRIEGSGGAGGPAGAAIDGFADVSLIDENGDPTADGGTILGPTS